MNYNPYRNPQPKRKGFFARLETHYFGLTEREKLLDELEVQAREMTPQYADKRVWVTSSHPVFNGVSGRGVSVEVWDYDQGKPPYLVVRVSFGGDAAHFELSEVKIA